MTQSNEMQGKGFDQPMQLKDTWEVTAKSSLLALEAANKLLADKDAQIERLKREQDTLLALVAVYKHGADPDAE